MPPAVGYCASIASRQSPRVEFASEAGANLRALGGVHDREPPRLAAGAGPRRPRGGRGWGGRAGAPPREAPTGPGSRVRERLGRRFPLRHPLAQALHVLVGGAHGLLGEIHLPPVPRLAREGPEREWVEPHLLEVAA